MAQDVNNPMVESKWSELSELADNWNEKIDYNPSQDLSEIHH